MKLGYIDYLNCYPYYYLMLEKETPAYIEVVPGYPSTLNQMIKKGELDMSPISSGAYPDLQDDVIILPEFSLSSIGYVRSVILISKIPIELLEKKLVGLSNASKTSVVLLKILLKKYYNISPKYIPTEPFPTLDNIDAALIIGNEAMLEMREPIPYTYDLGDLWLKKTGYPVVFAIFAVNKKSLKKHAASIDRALESFRESLKNLQTNREELIKNARQRYPKISFNIDSYYNLLKYEFTDDLLKALKFYLSEADKLDLLKKIKSFNMFYRNSASNK